MHEVTNLMFSFPKQPIHKNNINETRWKLCIKVNIWGTEITLNVIKLGVKYHCKMFEKCTYDYQEFHKFSELYSF